MSLSDCIKRQTQHIGDESWINLKILKTNAAVLFLDKRYAERSFGRNDSSRRLVKNGDMFYRRKLHVNYIRVIVSKQCGSFAILVQLRQCQLDCSGGVAVCFLIKPFSSVRGSDGQFMNESLF